MDQTATASPEPRINTITKADIREALDSGWADFKKAPKYGLFFGAVFSVIGIIISWMLIVNGSTLWVLPIAAGFPLIGPFAAVGLYEVSRRLESGEALNWGVVLGAVRRESRRQLPSYAFVAVFAFMVWGNLAHLVFALMFGTKSLTNILSSPEIFLTGSGVLMLLIGTGVGALIAGLLFAVSVISVPMMDEHEIDIVTAMITSWKATMQNKEAMALWAFIIAALSVLAMIPLFLGMLVVFPVLGHATWHIYRKVIS